MVQLSLATLSTSGLQHDKDLSGVYPACNITTGPVASEFGKKRQWGKLNMTLTHNVLGKVQSHF